MLINKVKYEKVNSRKTAKLKTGRKVRLTATTMVVISCSL